MKKLFSIRDERLAGATAVRNHGLLWMDLADIRDGVPRYYVTLDAEAPRPDCVLLNDYRPEHRAD